MLELNDVLLRGEASTLSMMAREGQLTVLTCAAADPQGAADGRLLRWLHAMMGLEPVVSGFVSLDGEPMTMQTAALLRLQMAFAPCGLGDVGRVIRYEAPSEQDVFALRANRGVAISNGMLAEEVRRTGAEGRQARLLAVAVLLRRPVLLVERPQWASVPYLQGLAAEGRTVVVASQDARVVAAADHVTEFS